MQPFDSVFYSRCIGKLMMCWNVFLIISCGDADTGFREISEPSNERPVALEDYRERPAGFDSEKLRDHDDAEPSQLTRSADSHASKGQEQLPPKQKSDDQDASHPTSQPIPTLTPTPAPAPTVSPDPDAAPPPEREPEPNLHLEIQFGQISAQASYISCAVMQLVFFKGTPPSRAAEQPESFDLGCSKQNQELAWPIPDQLAAFGSIQRVRSRPKQANTPYDKTTIELSGEPVCIELGLQVRTFRTLADWRRNGAHWERALPARQPAGDNRYFSLTEQRVQPDTELSKTEKKFEIGYEDLPGPYEKTDRDNNDLVIEITRSAGVDLRIPPFHESCDADD